LTFFPKTETTPEEGNNKPETMFNSVDFPQPVGPTIETNSPDGIDKLAFSKIAGLEES